MKEEEAMLANQNTLSTPTAHKGQLIKSDDTGSASAPHKDKTITSIVSGDKERLEPETTVDTRKLKTKGGGGGEQSMSSSLLCRGGLKEEEEEEESGRERLKRHRVEVAGQVWIPDTWGQEDLLKDWMDCSAFDSALVPQGIMSARAALAEEGRRAHSGRLGLKNSC